ncbi:hypothetical protein MD588_14955 [Photobacterium sp. SDRW27]|uniref:hypothetical protein n=1 Tax=Photobacterium obscurum TaxID=2829490 RepID=UPI002242DFFA|nr:hypothetical protein [Photobacterium obscurum]MCW8330106.1 hypothetical protein [Photobacterium obscurum]
MTLRKITLAAGCLILVACSEPEKPASTDIEPEAATETQVSAAEDTTKDTTPQTPAEPEVLEPEHPALPATADIWQSPTELMVSDVLLNLRSELWLNSMPVIGDDGTKPADKLHASVKLQSTDMQALPQGIEITQVLLEHEDKQWLVNENLEIRAEGELSLEVILRGGPEWVPGSKVNIAVNILHGGQEHTLVQHDVILSQVF